MSALSTVILALILAALVFLYNHLARELKEIDPLLLNNQTSISETRKSCESAIYRSVDVPHGVSVTRGLNLRSGYKIRDGCLKDVWYCGMKNRDDKLKSTEIVLGGKSFKIGEVNYILHQIALKFSNFENIGIYGDLMESPELLLVVWSCFFISDKTVVYFHSKDDLKSKIETPVFVLVTSSKYKSDIDSTSFNETIDIKPLLSTFDKEATKEFKYDPNKDFHHVNNHSFSYVVDGNETKFFQINFVSSIASKLLSIPSTKSWTKDDNMLISYTQTTFSNNNIIFETLCGLVSNLNRIELVNPDNISNLHELSQFKSSILCTDSKILKKLCTNSKKSFWQSFKLQRSEYFNSLGYFNTFGKIDKSLKLRIIYVAQLSPPLSPQLSSLMSNFCKSLTGSLIVREVYTNFTIGPILKTNIFDFRTVQNHSLTLLGVPANSVELKTVNFAECTNQGVIYVRGMSLGKSDNLHADDEFWVETDIIGKFARDGCFYGSIFKMH